MRLIPPQLQVRHLGPHERHVGELVHFRDDVIQYLARVALEVVHEGFQPAGIVVRERRYDYAQIGPACVVQHLLVARLE